MDVHSQELGALDDLHSSALYEERSVGGLVPLEVNDDLLCFVDIQVQIVQFASVHQMFHLLSVCQLFITPRLGQIYTNIQMCPNICLNIAMEL